MQPYRCQDTQRNLSHLCVFTLELKHTSREHTHRPAHMHTITLYTHSANRNDAKTPRWYLKVAIRRCFSHCCIISSSLSLSCLSVSLSHCQYLAPPHPPSLPCQATHPNMRTYYFCTDTAKEMESWMKVMTDAALVHSEPVRRSVLAMQIQWL